MGWQPALVIAAGALIIVCGLVAIITEWWLGYKAKQRRNRRLYGHGNIYSMKNFK